MRLMARFAGSAAAVFPGRHLRETGRFGGILFMTAGTESRHIGNPGFAGRIRGMGSERAMAGLAVYGVMSAGGLDLGLILMAERTLGLAGKYGWTGLDFIQRGRAVVPVSPEVFGNHGGPNDQEYADAGKHKGSQPYQVTGVAEHVSHARPLWARH